LSHTFRSMIHYLLTGVTLKGSWNLPAGPPLTVGDTMPDKFQTISWPVNEKL
jgi:hypothetical protein